MRIRHPIRIHLCILVQDGSGTPDITNPRFFEYVNSIKINHGGKNLFNDVWNTISGSTNNVTLEKVDDEFVVNSEGASGTVNFYIKRYSTGSEFTLPAGTYTLSGLPVDCPQGISLTIYSLIILLILTIMFFKKERKTKV